MASWSMVLHCCDFLPFYFVPTVLSCHPPSLPQIKLAYLTIPQIINLLFIMAHHRYGLTIDPISSHKEMPFVGKRGSRQTETVRMFLIEALVCTTGGEK